MQDIYGIEVTTIDGTVTTLSQYTGKVLLVVNVASKCGFTNQYAGLEELYQKYKDQGLVILGFPCNQFAGQEPGSEEDILNFCRLNYGVTFPMFAKIEVNGNNAHPLYKHLRTQCPGILGSEAIKWNFTKFLINQKGEVLKRYASAKKISEMENDIIQLLE
ncbi:glutathione peroxidase [Desulforhopalus sp. 52FAK]